MSRESELNFRLTKCEQDFSSLFRTNQFRSVDVSGGQKDFLKFVLFATATILVTIRDVDRLLQEATLGAGHQSIALKPLAFYRDTLCPNRMSMQSVFDQLVQRPDLFPEAESANLDEHEVIPASKPSENRPVWNMMNAGYDYWCNDESGTFSEDDIEAVGRLTSS